MKKIIIYLIIFLAGCQYTEKCVIENLLKSSRDGILPPNITKVEGIPGKIIYRSGQVEKEFIPALLKLEIRSIVTLNSVSQETKQILKTLAVSHKEFNFDGEKMTVSDLQKAVMVIINAPNAVLVHCYSGADRTGIVIAALRIYSGESDIDKLLEEMKKSCHIEWQKYNYYKNLLIEFKNNNNTP